ncbi:MAG: RraA family protein, partial [Pseudomonadota bacterium]
MTTIHPIPQKSAVTTDLLDRWKKIPIAVAVDLAPECQINPALRPLRPAGEQPPLFGRALTATSAAPDFGGVLKACELATAGDVLMIDAGGSDRMGMIGEILSGHLQRRGAVGLVCDGAIRDVGTIAKMENF